MLTIALIVLFWLLTTVAVGVVVGRAFALNDRGPRDHQTGPVAEQEKY